jgi:hypothetical protein
MLVRKGCRQIAGAALLYIAMACAAPTPYQPLTEGYGYSDRSLSEKRFEVLFHGNTETELPDVERYLLYRAAEVAAREGAPDFRVEEQHTEIHEILVPEPCHSPYYFTYFDYSIMDVEEEFEARAEIELLDYQPEASSHGMFVTDEVLSDLMECAG